MADLGLYENFLEHAIREEALSYRRTVARVRNMEISFEMPDRDFMALYRLNKSLTLELIQELEPYLPRKRGLTTVCKSAFMNWHHEECFFKIQCPASVADIGNFNKLTRDDQKRIRTTMKNSGIKKTARVCSADTIKSEYRHYLVQYSRSDMATCKYCNTKISKDEVRICKTEFYGPCLKYGQVLWHHVKCFAERRGELGYLVGAESLPGFRSLKKKDQAMLKNTIKPLNSKEMPLKKIKEEPQTEEELIGENDQQKSMEGQNKPCHKYRTALSEVTENSQEICSRTDDTQNHGTPSQTLKIKKENDLLIETVVIKKEIEDNCDMNEIIVNQNTEMHNIKSEIVSFDEMDSDETLNHKSNNNLNKDVDINDIIVNKNTEMHKDNLWTEELDIKSERDSYDGMNSHEDINIDGKDDDMKYGSENDEDYVDEDSGVPLIVPRMRRLLFNTFDEQDYPVVSLQKSVLTQQIQPTSLFDFDWKACDTKTNLARREIFSSANCGPVSTFRTPYEAFTAIWTRDFMEKIVIETNRYAQQSINNLREGFLKPSILINDWYETTVDEMYVYFGVILAMGMVVKINPEEYWDDKPSFLATPVFARYMPQSRFLLLSHFLHFNNNIKTDLSKLSVSEAKLFKISPVVSHLNSKFQNLYRLSRNIIIDESLFEYKGWRRRVEESVGGVKSWEVWDVGSGYLWKFVFETVERETPVSCQIATPILDLLEGFEYRGHTVWMDNKHSCPALARQLKSLGFDYVGSLYPDCQHLPTELGTLSKSKMKISSVSGFTSGDVDVLVYRYQIRVALISSFHGAGLCNHKGNTIATVLHDYNLMMRAADKRDRMLEACPIHWIRISQVWYKKLFFRLLNVSALNAFILLLNLTQNDEGRIDDQNDFRKQLIEEIMKRHHRV